MIQFVSHRRTSLQWRLQGCHLLLELCPVKKRTFFRSVRHVRWYNPNPPSFLRRGLFGLPGRLGNGERGNKRAGGTLRATRFCNSLVFFLFPPFSRCFSTEGASAEERAKPPTRLSSCFYLGKLNVSLPVPYTSAFHPLCKSVKVPISLSFLHCIISRHVTHVFPNSPGCRHHSREFCFSPSLLPPPTDFQPVPLLSGSRLYPHPSPPPPPPTHTRLFVTGSRRTPFYKAGSWS